MKVQRSGCESREVVHRRLSEIEVSHELLSCRRATSKAQVRTASVLEFIVDPFPKRRQQNVSMLSFRLLWLGAERFHLTNPSGANRL